MDHELPQRISWQGIDLYCPAHWEPAGMYGSWKAGQIIMAEGREPRMAVSWERKDMRPDIDKTAVKAAKQHMKRVGATNLTPPEPLGVDGSLVRMIGGPTDRAVGVRRVESAKATLIWRQLAPGSMAMLRKMIRSADAAADNETATWVIHGLNITLPPKWRSEGIQVLAGFVRGVWFHYSGRYDQVDQALIMRRYACAERLLDGQSLVTWLIKQMGKAAICETIEQRADFVELACTTPAGSWWRKFRGKREKRQVYAWLEGDNDRLTVQETIGGQSSLGCLRPTDSSPRCGPSHFGVAMGMP